MEYDITLQELPDHKQKNADLEVSSQNYKQQIICVQEWAEVFHTMWPDLTEEDLALWKDVGVAFKMRRRYRKFVLLYYLPRFL